MRLDLILSSRKSYTYEGYMARNIVSVLEKRRVSYKQIYLCDGILHDYIWYIKEKPPRSILSFADLFHYERPFCDLVRVPQFFWAMHTISEALSVLNSPYGTVGLPVSFPDTLYLPQGVQGASEEKSFDTVCFSPLIDLDDLQQMWEEFYPKEIVLQIQDALASEVSSSTPVLVAQAVEKYQKAKRTYALASTFEGESLHLFGEHVGNNWYTRLPNAKRIHLHYTLPYTEHHEVLKRSKQIALDPLEPHWIAPAKAYGCSVYKKVFTDVPVLDWEKQVDKLISYLNES